MSHPPPLRGRRRLLCVSTLVCAATLPLWPLMAFAAVMAIPGSSAPSTSLTLLFNGLVLALLYPVPVLAGTIGALLRARRPPGDRWFLAFVVMAWLGALPPGAVGMVLLIG